MNTTSSIFSGRTFRSAVVAVLMITALSSGRTFAQYDTIAVSILDSMSLNIGELESCSFSFSSEFDIFSEQYGLITHGEIGSVTLKAGNKMLVEKKGDKGHKVFCSDGKSFTVYSYDKNQYARIPSEISLIEFIDSVSSYYGIDFPGTDVFYPDFVDNLLETSDNLVYLGLSLTGGAECYHVAGVRDDMTFQFWITSDGSYLPMKMSLVYINSTGNPRYSIMYSDWKLNNVTDDSVFSFKVPEGANKINLSKRD